MKVLGRLRDVYSPKEIKFFLWCHVFFCSEYVKKNGHKLTLLHSSIPDYAKRWLAEQNAEHLTKESEANGETGRFTNQESMEFF